MDSLLPLAHMDHLSWIYQGAFTAYTLLKKCKETSQERIAVDSMGDT